MDGAVIHVHPITKEPAPVSDLIVSPFVPFCQVEKGTSDEWPPAVPGDSFAIIDHRVELGSISAKLTVV